MSGLRSENRTLIAAAALLALLVVLGSRAAGGSATAGRPGAPEHRRHPDRRPDPGRAAGDAGSPRWATASGRCRTRSTSIRKHGVSFNRYIASYPLCCPSRSTLLSGRYSHSNGVLSNSAPRGGWVAYQPPPDLQAQPRRLAAARRLSHDPPGEVPQRVRGAGARRPDDPGSHPAGTSGRATPRTTRRASTTATCSTTTAPSAGPFGSTDYAEISDKDGPGCPLTVPPRRLQLPGGPAHRPGGAPDRPLRPRQAVLPPARLQRPPRRLQPADRPRAGTPPLGHRGRHTAATAARVQRGRHLRQAQLHPRRRGPPRSGDLPQDADRVPEEPGVAALGRRGSRRG